MEKAFTVFTLLLLLAWPAAAQDNSRQILDEWLIHIPAAPQAQISEITSPQTSHLFPNYHFYYVMYPMYPVARILPTPLKPNNVVAVADGAVRQIIDENELKAFFQSALIPITSAEDASEAMKLWLSMAADLHQDGFFQFSPPDVSTATDDNEISASGSMAVTQGGKGAVTGILKFDHKGQLMQAGSNAQLMRGIRPVCQATKLLDPDPIVRKMAEKDILVMGRAARSYLDEQRAKASPALQKEIDRVWNRIVSEGW